MDDAEVEAALLALGPRLEWEDAETEAALRASGAQLKWSRDEELGEVADNGVGFYIITRHKFFGLSLGCKAKFSILDRALTLQHLRDVFISSNGPAPRPDKCPGGCKPYAEAKAACERHNATGEWE